MAATNTFFLQRIGYAKTKSYATMRREDPEFVAPSMIIGSASISMNNLHVSDPSQQLKKRPREDSVAGADEPKKKKEKADDDSDEEMEIEDEDEDEKPPAVNLVAGPGTCLLFVFLLLNA